MVNGITNNVKGTVLVVLADTLAAHQLGGFKIGVGFALRKCRHCMATDEDVQNKVCLTHSICMHAPILYAHSLQKRDCIEEPLMSMTTSVLFFKVHCQVLTQQRTALIIAAL